MLEGSAGPKSQNGKVNFNRDIMKHTNIEIPCYFRFLPSCYVLKIGVSVVALMIESDLESWTDLYNELDFEVLSDSFKTYPENGHYL